MKTARFVLKLVALGLSVASVVCLIIAYWDKISEVVCAVSEKVSGKLESKKEICICENEFADYADCDL